MKKTLAVAWGIGGTLIAFSAVWAAAAGTRAEGSSVSLSVSAVISTLLYGLIGIVLAILGFKLFDALIPFNLEQEICEKHNLAVAILCAAMVLGICIIVAAAVL
jgi:uncharacterized membrane protein YjfL (UPF0719 family)